MAEDAPNADNAYTDQREAEIVVRVFQRLQWVAFAMSAADREIASEAMKACLSHAEEEILENLSYDVNALPRDLGE